MDTSSSSFAFTESTPTTDLMSNGSRPTMKAGHAGVNIGRSQADGKSSSDDDYGAPRKRREMVSPSPYAGYQVGQLLPRDASQRQSSAEITNISSAVVIGKKPPMAGRSTQRSSTPTPRMIDQVFQSVATSLDPAS